jgi:hypothetical protein
MIDFKSDPKILLDIVRERLQIQFAFFDALDTKSATLFAAGSALLGILAAVFAIREEFDSTSLVVMSVASGAYVALVLGVAATHWPRHYDVGPQLDSVWNDAQLKDDKELVTDLVVDYINYYRNNDRWTWVKVLSVRVGLVAVVVETAAVAIGLAVVA